MSDRVADPLVVEVAKALVFGVSFYLPDGVERNRTAGTEASGVTNLSELIKAATRQARDGRSLVVTDHEVPAVLELLRIHSALERIAATGAKYRVTGNPDGHALIVWFGLGGNREASFGDPGYPLAADIAEAGADWAEAQVATKVAKCKCCGKRCE